MRTPRTALVYYVRRYALVRAKIDGLQGLADKQFGHDPEAIHRGAFWRPSRSAPEPNSPCWCRHCAARQRRGTASIR